MKYLTILLISVMALLSTSCTVYTEKRSEALSQAVTATSDSIDVARFDLANQYSKEAVKLAFPPKHKIKISGLVTKKETVDAKTSIITTNTVTRIVVPKELERSDILVVGSPEWEELLKNKDFAEQLKIDNINLTTLKTNVEKELTKQNEMQNKMIQDLNTMQKKLVEKDLAILWRNIVIVSLIATMAAAVYLRIKGIL